MQCMLSNCWEILRAIILQHKVEITPTCESKKYYGLDNQQLSPDEGKVQRLLPVMVLGASAPKRKPSKTSMKS